MVREEKDVSMAGDTWEQLVSEVHSHGGMLKVSMQRLRDLNGTRKLGPHVCTAIQGTLASLGLATHPATLPTKQQEDVRVYSVGGLMERIMKAVLKPSDEGDTLLRGLAEDNAAQKLLEVRRLIDSAA